MFNIIERQINAVKTAVKEVVTEVLKAPTTSGYDFSIAAKEVKSLTGKDVRDTSQSMLFRNFTDCINDMSLVGEINPIMVESDEVVNVGVAVYKGLLITNSSDVCAWVKANKANLFQNVMLVERKYVTVDYVMFADKIVASN